MEPSRSSCFQHRVGLWRISCGYVSSLSTPRMTILTASSGKGRSSASLRPAFSDMKPVKNNNVVADSACEEVADLCRDLLRMGLEREVTCFEEMDHGTGNIAPERLSTARQEKGVVLSPDR